MKADWSRNSYDTDFAEHIKEGCKVAEKCLERARQDILETFKRINGVEMKMEKDINFNDAELETMLGFIEKELEFVETKLDALEEKEENLMEFRDKVLFKLGR